MYLPNTCLYDAAEFFDADTTEMFQASCNDFFDLIEANLRHFCYKHLVGAYDYHEIKARQFWGDDDAMDEECYDYIAEWMQQKTVYDDEEFYVHKSRIVYYRLNRHFDHLSTIVCLTQEGTHRILPLLGNVYIETVGYEADAVAEYLEDPDEYFPEPASPVGMHEHFGVFW